MEIFWIKLSKLTNKQFYEEMKNPTKKSLVFTPNPEILLAGKKDPEFKKILNAWDYLIPDWIGIYAGFQIVSDNLPRFLSFLLIPYYGLNLFIKRRALYAQYWERICGSDFTRKIIEYSNEKGLWVTIVDKFQAPGNKWDNLKIERQKTLVSQLEEKYPNARFHMYICDWGNTEEIISKINETDDIYLFSSQGQKIQEMTIAEMLPKLNNVKVAAGIWWSFDLITWFKRRAPRIFVRLWLEWLWRLILHPQWMMKRIWRAIFVFLWEVVKSK
ncbi:MAG: glycosyl transferase, WecB/TagA/CpsF family protein [uncultured bacterium (gcode 4)]|uniref:Glycosyl transferase, WecB/TagA/CpsF family protein n=1 Tax=uncultured bacterium (gcode 4) TaxID=1234023 RepID=K2G471_9BACT|nr:MAG: glycosyl transferase, WecB/TagA/CpsF family protein [uncultured bacterium (gcode 4)]